MENQKTSGGKLMLLGLQHMFAMFGATVLVPILTGLSPAVALFCAGVGTLLFYFITKRKVPVFLGSSFSFIAAIILAAATCASGDIAATFKEGFAASGYNAIGFMFGDGAAITQNPSYLEALPYATGGIIVAGALYLVLALLVKIFGADKIKSFFPPVVTGPVIICIGLGLAPVAIGYMTGWESWVIAAAVVVTVIGISIFTKGFFKMVPLLFGLIIGYVVSMGFGIVDFSGMQSAEIIALPNFMLPKFDWRAIVIVAPIAIVTFVEHIGDITANGAVIGKDLIKDPGLHRTLIGDGVATMFAGLVGGPANTTYSENTGVLAATGNYNPVSLAIAACFAIIMSFIGKFSAFLSSIPSPVIGGMSIVLFGMIAAVGLRTLVTNKVDFGNTRNLLIVSIMLVIGIGGATIPINPDAGFFLQGYGLTAVIGIILNKILPEEIGKKGKKNKKAEASQ
ncbi:MAG: uracil-xanthine permease family protein [Eubacteriales bacterium]|nr:uracil-xanthine permease family protein [Eubacteriales bacterium]